MATKMKKYGNGGWEKTTPGHVTPKMSNGGNKPKKALLKRIFGRKTDEEKKQELINNPGSKPEINYTNPYSKPEGKKGMVVKTKMKIGGTKTKAMYGTSVKPGMMKNGGIKKTLRKAQYGIADTTPGQMLMDEPMPTGPMSIVPSGRGDMEGLNTPYGQFRKPEPTSEQDRRAAYGKKGIIVKKTGTMKTKTMYKTGGMVNANARVAASKVAKGRVGGTSVAPKKAIPKAKYGMSMKGKKSC